jgi:hypothetical protein
MQSEVTSELWRPIELVRLMISGMVWPCKNALGGGNGMGHLVPGRLCFHVTCSILVWVSDHCGHYLVVLSRLQAHPSVHGSQAMGDACVSSATVLFTVACLHDCCAPLPNSGGARVGGGACRSPDYIPAGGDCGLADEAYRCHTPGCAFVPGSLPHKPWMYCRIERRYMRGGPFPVTSLGYSSPRSALYTF